MRQVGDSLSTETTLYLHDMTCWSLLCLSKMLPAGFMQRLPYLVRRSVPRSRQCQC
jgi:hypothetical protein